MTTMQMPGWTSSSFPARPNFLQTYTQVLDQAPWSQASFDHLKATKQLEHAEIGMDDDDTDARLEQLSVRSQAGSQRW